MLHLVPSIGGLIGIVTGDALQQQMEATFVFLGSGMLTTFNAGVCCILLDKLQQLQLSSESI